MTKPKVIVGMSGGVDSSVAAYILKEQGYEVIGATMEIWQDEKKCHQEENADCCVNSAIEDAKKVCDILNIPHYVMNFKKEFNENVVTNFISEYLQGRTPNPCVVCNRFVKWQYLLERSMQIGAQYIATGHYAQIIKLDNGRYTLKKSAAVGKDQTYVLYDLTQKQLKHTLMPLGNYDKNQVRNIAEQIGLKVANKPDSQEICFIPDNDYGNFIKQNTEKEIKPGSFVDTQGNVLGQHKGIINYTVGQRKGLGLSLGKPGYVVEIRPQTNEVVIGTNEEVFKDKLYAHNLNWMAVENIQEPMKVKAKIRYSHKEASATITKVEDKILCQFETPQRAITPGQAVVFYQQDYIIGGGTII